MRCLFFIIVIYLCLLFIGRGAEGEREVKAALPISVGITYTLCLGNINVYILRRILTNTGFMNPIRSIQKNFFKNHIEEDVNPLLRPTRTL